MAAARRNQRAAPCSAADGPVVNPALHLAVPRLRLRQAGGSICAKTGIVSVSPATTPPRVCGWPEGLGGHTLRGLLFPYCVVAPKPQGPLRGYLLIALGLSDRSTRTATGNQRRSCATAASAGPEPTHHPDAPSFWPCPGVPRLHAVGRGRSRRGCSAVAFPMPYRLETQPTSGSARQITSNQHKATTAAAVVARNTATIIALETLRRR